MFDFVLNAFFWTLALYGMMEIIKTIYYICTYERIDKNGMTLIIAVKNQEKQIEGFCRSILFRYLAGKKDYVNSIIVTDLNSSDGTKEIIKKLEEDYQCIQLEEWEKCKEELDYICNK